MITRTLYISGNLSTNLFVLLSTFTLTALLVTIPRLFINRNSLIPSTFTNWVNIISNWYYLHKVLGRNLFFLVNTLYYIHISVHTTYESPVFTFNLQVSSFISLFWFSCIFTHRNIHISLKIQPNLAVSRNYHSCTVEPY